MKSFNFLLTLIALLTAAVVLPAQTGAGVITIYLTSQTTAAGGSGSVDILLRNDMGADVDISAFDTILEVTAGSGLTFTAVDEIVSAPYSYIFGTIQTPPLGDISNPNSPVLSDSHATSFQTITSGQTVGLGRLSYTIDPSTPDGLIPIIFSPDTTGYLTHVYDGAFNELPLFLTGGVITVASAVPEPSSLCLLATGCLLYGARILRRRRAAAPGKNTASTP